MVYTHTQDNLWSMFTLRAHLTTSSCAYTKLPNILSTRNFPSHSLPVLLQIELLGPIPPQRQPDSDFCRHGFLP